MNPPATIETVARAQPVIQAMLAHGYHVLVDEAKNDQEATWIKAGPLYVQVHPTLGYALYRGDNKPFVREPNEGYPFDKLDILLKRMRGLLETKT